MLYLYKHQYHTRQIEQRAVALLVVLIMVCGSGDSVIGYYHGSAIMYGSIFLNFVITGMLCLRNGKINAFMLKVSLIMCLAVFASMIVNLDWHGYTMWILLATALFVEESIDYEIFYQMFENVILWLSIFSLVGMALWFFIPDLVMAFPQVDGRGIDLRNLFVTTVPVFYEKSSFRNFGFFREPAMFCIYLGLALVRQIFFVENVSVKRILIYLVTIVTTKSATGYLATAFLMTMYILFKKKRQKDHKLLMVILIGGIVAERRMDLSGYILHRMDTKGASAASISSRLYSILCGLMTAMTDPIFGRGAVKSQLVFQECVSMINAVYRGVSWANMVTYLFASFGLIFVSFFLMGLLGMSRSFHHSRIILWVAFIFIMLLLCGEVMTYSTIMYTFMMYGLKNFHLCGWACNPRHPSL